MIEMVRQLIDREEFDYQALMSALSGFASPRDRVTALLKSGAIIRVKKGLYIFGELYRRRPYCKELLANLMYGPSVVSGDYALSWYGLIPEQVVTVTSVTTGRSRRFETPVGLFTYGVTKDLSVGVCRTGSEHVKFLMASPERALADKIISIRGAAVRSQKQMRQFLEEDIRLDMQAFYEMNPGVMEEVALCYRSPRMDTLLNIMQKRGRA